jgi:cbb3-type cytochrome oxidase subunit 1
LSRQFLLKGGLSRWLPRIGRYGLESAGFGTMMVCGSIFNILMDFDVRFELHVLAANQHHFPVAFLGIAQYFFDYAVAAQQGICQQYFTPTA